MKHPLPLFTAQRTWPVLAGLLLASLFFQPIAGAGEFPAVTADGFAIPQPGREFIFPRDHGSHPEFAVEWWYITGHLTGAGDERFGFQATFFRRALKTADGTNPPPVTAFGHEQIYLAHMALVNKSTGDFRYQERLNRNGWDAASATDTLDVRNGNWSLRRMATDAPDAEAFELHATIGADIDFQLRLAPGKPPVIFGSNGVSRKAAEPSAASHYLTFPRMAVSGTLTLGEVPRTVTGEAWMDHEISSSQLGKDQVGWDWLSLQLLDGRNLMAYRMRRTDGTTDPYSTVAWVDLQNRVRHTGPDQFQWTILKRWHSPKTGADYPALVRLEAVNPATGQTEQFLVEPEVADQELAGATGGVAYWEGACTVRDGQQKLIGRAYMELTGYAASLRGKF